jgi:hypothetical protein
MGHTMSVAGSPPADSYCTGRVGSRARSRTAILARCGPNDASLPRDHVITHAVNPHPLPPPAPHSPTRTSAVRE